MGREPDDNFYSDPDGSPTPVIRHEERHRETTRRLADEERDNAVRDAARSEQLSRDADHARHLAETTDDPVAQRRAQAWASDAGHQAMIIESHAWRGFRAADIDDRSADTDSAQAADPTIELDYDSRQRREQLAEQLQSRGIDHEVVASRVRADVGQARPATAINRRPTMQKQLPRSRARARSRVVRRSGRSR